MILHVCNCKCSMCYSCICIVHVTVDFENCYQLRNGHIVPGHRYADLMPLEHYVICRGFYRSAQRHVVWVLASLK